MSSILICSSGGINTYSNKQNILVCGPIYKESYARLMTAQHLRRTYAELVNCKRLTKNRKLNLRKIYAKLNPFTTGTHYTGFRAKFDRAPEPNLLVITNLLTAGAQ